MDRRDFLGIILVGLVGGVIGYKTLRGRTAEGDGLREAMHYSPAGAAGIAGEE